MVIPNKEVLLKNTRNGIYYHDMEDNDLVLVNLVEENREGLTCRELSEAREARQALAMFGYQSQKTFDHMARNINSFPVIIEEVCNANTI